MYLTFFYFGAAGAAAAAAFRIADLKRKRVPYLTILICLALGACLILQALHPAALLMFERNAAAIGAGEWWRIGAALFFQDGGVSGGVSNIFFLAIIGSLAEQVWKRRYWLALYIGAGVAAEFVALAWQPIGAGNSVAVFGLAAGICAYSFAEKTGLAVRILSAISAACAGALLVQLDIHGAAFYIGMGISALLFATADPVLRRL
jgi:membrane associated rhomboid family serine protease